MDYDFETVILQQNAKQHDVSSKLIALECAVRKLQGDVNHWEQKITENEKQLQQLEQDLQNLRRSSKRLIYKILREVGGSLKKN